jgi:hypothetical protein
MFDISYMKFGYYMFEFFFHKFIIIIFWIIKIIYKKTLTIPNS